MATTCLVLMGVLSPGSVFGQSADPGVRFASVGRGLLTYLNERGQGSGLAAVDFDDDGDIDVYVPEAAGRPDRMYVNTNGWFIDRASVLGLARTAQSRMALWFDYDNDHDLDLLVMNDAEHVASSFTLYQQDSEHLFSDVTAEAGLMIPAALVRDWGGAAAGDLDNDGWLDFYACNWGGPAHLFMNNRDGTFRDASDASGVNWQWRTRWTPVMLDFNGDGWLDLYVANDLTTNELWINNGDGTFVNRAQEAGLSNASYDMGLTFGDYDNDGDFDIYISNVFYNLLFRNDSNGDVLRFTDVAGSMGVSGPMWGWGTSFFDADRDGNVDLAVTNGYFRPEWAADTSRFYWNPSGGTGPFRDVSRLVGFNDTYWGSGLAAFDYDRDGDIDMMQVCMESARTSPNLILWENRLSPPASDRHWLTVQPRIDGNNYFAIGSVVKVEAAGHRQMRLITAGTSYLSQEPAEAFFGLGSSDHANVRIEWPDGTATEIQNAEADRVLTIVQPTIQPIAPQPFAVLGAQPNPTPGGVNLAFTLPLQGPVKVDLFDMTGRRLDSFDAGTFNAGAHTLSLPMQRNLRPGVYQVRLASGTLRAATRVVVIP